MAKSREKAYQVIKAAILDREFPPGMHLKEEQLVARVGVSRTPIREALRLLVSEGFLNGAANQGVFVSAPTYEELRERFELRGLLEGHAAERAALRATPAMIAELAELAHEMADLVAKEGVAFDEVTRVNSRFHRLILEAADSPKLAELVRHLVEVPVTIRTFRNYDATALARSASHHVELVNAFRARDPGWAGSVMRSHVASAWSTLAQAAERDGNEGTAAARLSS